MQGWKKGVPTVEQLKAMEARLWHANLRLWMWRNHTLNNRSVFYDQFPEKKRKPGVVRSGDVVNKHRIFSVMHAVEIQKNVVVSIPSGFMRCERCRLMGVVETFYDYYCS